MYLLVEWKYTKEWLIIVKETGQEGQTVIEHIFKDTSGAKFIDETYQLTPIFKEETILAKSESLKELMEIAMLELL